MTTPVAGVAGRDCPGWAPSCRADLTWAFADPSRPTERVEPPPNIPYTCCFTQPGRDGLAHSCVTGRVRSGLRCAAALFRSAWVLPGAMWHVGAASCSASESLSQVPGLHLPGPCAWQRRPSCRRASAAPTHHRRVATAATLHIPGHQYASNRRGGQVPAGGGHCLSKVKTGVRAEAQHTEGGGRETLQPIAGRLPAPLGIGRHVPGRPCRRGLARQPACCCCCSCVGGLPRRRRGWSPRAHSIRLCT